MGIREDTIDAAPYDFGVPQRLGREAIAGLRRIHADVARDLEYLLSGVFGSDVRGSIVALEQTRYQNFIDDLAPQALHAIIGSEALAGDFKIVLPGRTGLRLVDKILGTESTEERPLTKVDASLIEDLIPQIVGTISTAFDAYHPLGASINRTELDSQLVKLVPGDDVVVVIELLFTVDDDDLSVTICYPQKAVVPILSSLNAIEQHATDKALNTASPIRGTMLRVPIEVRVQLPSAWMSAESLHSLKVGDVLQTGIAAETAPILSIAGRPALSVRPTTRLRKVACVVVGTVPDASRSL